MKRLFFFLLMMLGILHLGAQQEYYVLNYGINDGLKVRGKSCISQINGFIWVGASDGLIGFDGQSSHIYPIPDEEGLGGYYCRVTSVAPTKAADTFWVGSKRGIYIFDMNVERLREFKAQGMPEFPNVADIHLDAQGRLWVLANSQVYVINVEKRKAECISKGLVNLACLMITQNGSVWMADNGNMLYRYNVPYRRMRSYEVKPEGAEQFSNIVSITEMKDGQLALTSAGDGVCLFSPETFTSKMLITQDDEGLPIEAHTTITTEGDDLWIGTERGVLYYRLKDKSLVGIRQNSLIPNTLSDDAVYSLCYDGDDGIWVGTFFGGINRISLTPKNFYVSLPESKVEDGEEEVDVIRNMCGDAQGHLWVGTEDGSLYLFDRETKKLRLADIAWGEHPRPFNVQGLQTIDNDLWVSTAGDGIYVVDTQTLQLKRRYTRTNSSEVSQPINGNSLCYQQGTLFVSTSHGIFIFDPTDETFHLMPDLAGVYSHQLFADQHGNVWVTTFDKGLWKIQKKKGKWVGKQTPFPYKSTTVMMEDSRGIYWVGTDCKGMMRYDDKTGKATPFTKDERLLRQSVNNIIEDSRHRLWINTFDGLYCYNMERNTVNRFTTINGLPSDYLNYASGFRDPDGTIYVGSYRGLVRFNPTSFSVPRKRLQPYFLYLNVNGVRIVPEDNTGILQQSLFLTKEINLTYDQNTFSLNFAVASFKPGNVIWYRYRFNPDEPWVITDSHTPLQMNNLAPGKYEITLQASYKPDVWEGPKAVIYVNVAPPGWISPGALLGYVFFIVMVVVIVMSFVRNESEKKEKEKENSKT